MNAQNAFTAGNSTWTFTPSSLDAKVTSVDNTIYASYGWWVHTADNGDLIVSAFAADRGNVTDATGITALRGTAKYMGGAAGQYTLRGTTGGANDAGDFTADATLDANFEDDTITGTIDNFIGEDGKSRDWSVELKEASINDGGLIARDVADDTVWTVGGTAAEASGEWSGSLQDNDAGGVPKIATGTFNSTYGTAEGLDGRMVGAFGAKKQ